MRYIKPVFFDVFSCTADRCPDTCCAGWQIMIDEDSLEKYSKVQGSFGKRLRNSIDWQEGCFYQHQSRCAFLNEENLCDLYTALGSDALCDTCRKYPRHVEEYEGLREWSLSLSCPVAAEIILSQQGFAEFLTEEDEEPDELEDEFEDFDLLLFTRLEDARNAIFQRLSRWAKRSENSSGLLEVYGLLKQNMQRALALAKDMQECLEDGDFSGIEELIRIYQAEDEMAEEQKYSDENDYKWNLNIYQTMYGLERLRPEWNHILKEMHRALYEGGEENYEQIKKDFTSYLNADEKRIHRWENTGLQLFVFFLYTYFCGAVYDDWIYPKMMLAVHSVGFIQELLIARWMKKGDLDEKDYIELSYCYAREIEHSDQNLNDLEEFYWQFFQDGIDN